MLKNIDENIIKKYTNGFMYVDYPHKSIWSTEMDGRTHRTALKKLFLDQKDESVMLYVHLPFCPELCYFCLCHTVITKKYDKVKRYLDFLYREIDLLRNFFDEHGVTPKFREIHLGGGTPTVLEEKEFGELIEKIKTIVDLQSLGEFSLEIDPRTLAGKKDRLKFYHSKGINRISMGIQDFDPVVQKTINRTQSRELVEDLLTPDVRQYFNSVNFDVLVGLPRQTKESFKKTIETVIELNPDRIDLAFFNYAPRNAPHMRVLKDAGRPNDVARQQLFLDATNALVASGYTRIGFDHFALPTDNQAIAMEKEELRWNTLGYSPGDCRSMLGIGVNSVSRITDNYYFQNIFDEKDYEDSIAKGRLPIFRGLKLNSDDVVRRDIINRLRSNYHIEYNEIGKQYNLNFRDYFKEEIAVAKQFAQDGILEVFDSGITITEKGKHFCNLICRVFDNYNRGGNYVDNFFEHNKSNDFGITPLSV